MKQKKLSLGVRFGLAAASCFLGLLLFIAVLVTSVIADIQVVTAKDNLRSFVHQLISSPVQIREHAPLQSGNGLRIVTAGDRTYRNMPHREEPAGLAASLTDQLVDMLYSELSDQMGGELTITQERMEELIEASTVKDYIADKTASLISDYVVGEITTTFEAEEIIDLLEENKEIIEEVPGEPLPAELSQQMAAIFDENEIIQKVEAEGLAGFMELTQKPLPGLDAETEGVGQDSLGSIIAGATAAIRALSATSTLVWCILICLVLMAAIMLINIRQLSKGLRRSGYPLIAVGVLIVPCLLAYWAPNLWTVIPGLTVVQQILKMLTPVYAVILALGLGLVIAGIVVGVVLRRKRKAAEKALPVPAEDEAAEPTIDALPADAPALDAAEASEEEPAAEIAEEAAPILE